MLHYLSRHPDALALVLLLLGATMWVGLAAARRRNREPATDGDEEPPLTTWPHLLRRELIAALAVTLFVSWWAILLPLPLGPVADSTVTPLSAKAPWFFVGIQEMLQYFDPWLAGAVLPLLMVFGLCALPYLDPDSEGGGRYSLGRPAALGLLGLLLVWLLPMIVGQLFRGEHWMLQPAWHPAPVDPPLPPPQPLSLGDRLGLQGGLAQVVGAVVCLGPYLLLPLSWRRASRVGWARFLVAGVLLITALGIGVKVLLVATLDVRYLWVNSWFRI